MKSLGAPKDSPFIFDLVQVLDPARLRADLRPGGEGGVPLLRPPPLPRHWQVRRHRPRGKLCLRLPGVRPKRNRRWHPADEHDANHCQARP